MAPCIGILLWGSEAELVLTDPASEPVLALCTLQCQSAPGLWEQRWCWLALPRVRLLLLGWHPVLQSMLLMPLGAAQALSDLRERRDYARHPALTSCCTWRPALVYC